MDSVFARHEVRGASLRKADHAGLHLNRIGRLKLLAILSLAAAPALAAPVTYEYTGHAFTSFNTVGGGTSYTGANHISISMTLASALGAGLSQAFVTPTAFSLSDGLQTITDANATNSFFGFSTDAAGTIVSWHVGAIVSNTFVGGGVSDELMSESAWSSKTGLQQTSDSGNQVTCGPDSAPGVGCAYYGNGFAQSYGAVSANAGTWSIAETAGNLPEPPALALAGLALSMLPLAARRRTR